MMDLYSWLKALHIISFTAWMAGLFYLPRLYVYHAQQEPDSPTAQVFQVMERKLLRLIMNPAMIATLVFGTWLIFELGDAAWSMGWLHAKLALVLILAVFHGQLARWRRDFELGCNRYSQRFYRWANEVPTLILIAVVILVVVRPF